MLTNVRTSAVVAPLTLAFVLGFASVNGAFAQRQGPGQAQGQTQTPGQTQVPPVAPAQAQQGQEASTPGGLDVPFTSAIGVEGEQVVNGVFTVQRFVHEGARIIAIGRVIATTADSEGNVQNFVTQTRLPVLPSTTRGDVCTTLHIELGPLDVELRGRRLQLDQIATEITAQSVDITSATGPDNRLASQLCSIGGLLDARGVSSGVQLSEQLNQLLEIIG